MIQKIHNVKANPYGEYKELKVDSTTWKIDGDTQTKYSYIYTGGRFERPIKDAYKISIHKSYRENGQVKKKQWSICTLSYYDLFEFSICDCADNRISKISEMTGITVDSIYDMIYEKLQPIIDAAEAEFKKMPEYKAKKKHRDIINKYLKAKKKFEDKYGIDTYDYCYDAFGVLRNAEYLKHLNDIYETKQKYKSSYYDNSKSNYSDYDFSGYFGKLSSNYTEDEKEKLKKIYKVLALRFHPDMQSGDAEMMKFINKLKQQWGI